jgi:hypothetical protein
VGYDLSHVFPATLFSQVQLSDFKGAFIYANNINTHPNSMRCAEKAVLERIPGTESTQIRPSFPRFSYDFWNEEPTRNLRVMARGPFWSLSPTRTITDSGTLMDE